MGAAMIITPVTREVATMDCGFWVVKSVHAGIVIMACLYVAPPPDCAVVIWVNLAAL